MLVKEVMSSPVVTVRPGTSLKEAIQLLERHSITAMPVVDGHGAIVGVISEADVIREAVLPDARSHELPLQLSGDPRPARVVDVMSHHALTVPAASELSVAADLLVSTTVKSLPVVEGGAIVGMVSRRDIVRVLARQDELMEIELDDLIRSSGQDWLVEVKDGIVSIEGPETERQQRLAQVLVCTIPGVVGIQFKTPAVG